MKNKSLLLVSTLLLVACGNATEQPLQKKVSNFTSEDASSELSLPDVPKPFITTLNLGSYAFKDSNYTLSVQYKTIGYYDEHASLNALISASTNSECGFVLTMFNPNYLNEHLYSAPLALPTTFVKCDKVTYSRTHDYVSVVDNTYSSVVINSVDGNSTGDGKIFKMKMSICLIEMNSYVDLVATYISFEFNIASAVNNGNDNGYYGGVNSLNVESTTLTSWEDFKGFQKVTADYPTTKVA